MDENVTEYSRIPNLLLYFLEIRNRCIEEFTFVDKKSFFFLWKGLVLFAVLVLFFAWACQIEVQVIGCTVFFSKPGDCNLTEKLLKDEENSMNVPTIVPNFCRNDELSSTLSWVDIAYNLFFL